MHYIIFDEESYVNGDGAVTLVHKIAHAVLNHQNPNAPACEREAEIFAAEFLSPMCVIAYLDRKAKRKLTNDELKPYFRSTRALIASQRIALAMSEPYMPDGNETKILRRLFDN